MSDNASKRKPANLIHVWEAAIPSNKARTAFLPQDIRDKESALPRADLLSALTAATEAGQGDWQNAVQQYLNPMNQANAQRAEILEKGAQAVVQWVKAGDILAVAFEKPRSVDCVPVRLKWEWLKDNPRFIWEKGTLSVEGLSFVEVRFITRKRAVKVLDEQSQDAAQTTIENVFPPSKPVGRPAMMPKIVHALEVLDKAGEIDRTASMKSHFNNIRQWLMTHCSELNVTEDSPGDDVLRRSMKEYLQEQDTDT
tara:strand:+ start:36 stop:797 length:762 start_codon:yes stop_codon:yes gene_type:complete